MRRWLGMLSLASVLVVGCNIMITDLGVPAIKGSGTLQEETRDLADFHGVEIGSALEATIRVGPKGSIKVSGDDNLVPLVKTVVRDGRLVARVDSPGGVQPVKPLKLTITTPSLDYVEGNGASRLDVTAGEAKSFAVEASGASTVAVKGVEASELGIQASGASRVTVAGKGRRLKIGASGASHVATPEIAAETVRADLSGASGAEVRASDAIEGDVSGAGNLRVLGAPKSRQLQTSGAGSVKFVAADSAAK
jgi:hypothetical protein